LDADLIRSMRAAGFEDVEIVHRYADRFADVSNPSSPMEFGTQGIPFRARKPT
jgi:hypothetical protein